MKSKLSILSLFLTLIVLEGLSQESQNIDLAMEYEPNEIFPYGRPNPNAPAEIMQYAFIIGSCTCENERYSYPDGKVTKYQSIWNNSWTMNGWAIKDRFFFKNTAAISVRIFDNTAKKWKLTYFIPSPYYAGEWVGEKKGDKIIMEKEEPLGGRKAISRLTYYDITDDGFKWISENIFENGEVFVDWKLTCQKNK